MGDSARERGASLMQDVCGVSVPSGESRFVDMTIEHLFAEVWSNETLSIRDRRLIVLGILGASGDGSNLTVHMSQALSRGDLDAEELAETALQIAHYAGWPKGTLATQIARQVAEEAAKTTD